MKRLIVLVLGLALMTFAACNDDDSSSKMGKALLGFPANGSNTKMDLLVNDQLRWKTVQNPDIYKNWDKNHEAALQPEIYEIYFDLYVSESATANPQLVEHQTATLEWNDSAIATSKDKIYNLFKNAGIILAVGKTYYWQVAVTLPDGTYTMSDKKNFTVIPSDPTGFTIEAEQIGSKITWNTALPSEYGDSTSPVVCDLYVSTTVPVIGTSTPVVAAIKPSSYSAGAYNFYVNSKDFSPATFDFVTGIAYYVTIVTKPALPSANTVSTSWNVTEVARGYKYRLHSDWTTTIASADFNYDTTTELYADVTAYLKARYLTTDGTLASDIGSNYVPADGNQYPSLLLGNSQAIGLDAITLNNFSNCSFKCDFRMTAEPAASEGFNLIIDDSNNESKFIGTDYDFSTPSDTEPNTNYVGYLKGIVVSVRFWADDPKTIATGDQNFTVCGYSIAANGTVDTVPGGAVTPDGDALYDVLETQLTANAVSVNKWHRLQVVRTGSTLQTSQYVVTLDGGTAGLTMTIPLVNVGTGVTPTHPYEIGRASCRERV